MVVTLVWLLRVGTLELSRLLLLLPFVVVDSQAVYGLKHLLVLSSKIVVYLNGI